MLSKASKQNECKEDRGSLQDLDLNDDDGDTREPSSARMITAPMLSWRPPTVQESLFTPRQQLETVHEVVFRSIKDGDSPEIITIPNYCITDKVVFYEVVTCNKLLQWNSWMRYCNFAKLHSQLKGPARDLGVRLPPFPKKKSKLFYNHRSTMFIEKRRVSLQNYLRKVNDDPAMRYSENFIWFLLPAPRDGASFAHIEKLEEKLDRPTYTKMTWDSGSDDSMQTPARPLYSFLPLAMVMPDVMRDRKDSFSISPKEPKPL